MFAAAPRVALPALVKITVKGVITSGIDQTGVFGAENTNLAGKDYTQAFIVDDAKGTKTILLGNPPYASSIAATAGSNPIKATLTIGAGKPLAYGVLPTSVTPNSLVSRQSDQTSIFTGDEAYAVGNAFGEGAMTAVVNFAYPPYTANYTGSRPWNTPRPRTTPAAGVSLFTMDITIPSPEVSCSSLPRACSKSSKSRLAN